MDRALYSHSAYDPRETPAVYHNTDAIVLRAIVRGRLSVADLATTSLRIGAFGAKTASSKRLAVRISATDIAEGLIANKDDPAELADWASFMVAAIEHFVFEDDRTASTDRLIAGIWELAFGANLSEPTLRVAKLTCEALHAA